MKGIRHVRIFYYQKFDLRVPYNNLSWSNLNYKYKTHCSYIIRSTNVFNWITRALTCEDGHIKALGYVSCTVDTCASTIRYVLEALAIRLSTMFATATKFARWQGKYKCRRCNFNDKSVYRGEWPLGIVVGVIKIDDDTRL